MDSPNTDIDIIINNITSSLRNELSNLEQKNILKNKKLIEETNLAILNLPIVQKVIYGYEREIEKTKSYQYQSLIEIVNNMKVDIDEMKQCIKLLNTPKEIIKVNENNIQLKIIEITDN